MARRKFAASSIAAASFLFVGLVQSKTRLMSLGRDTSTPSGLSPAAAAVAEGSADLVGAGVLCSAPAILSLAVDLSSPLPQAVSSRAAVAVSAAATGKER